MVSLRDIFQISSPKGIPSLFTIHSSLFTNFMTLPYGEAQRNFGIHTDRDWHTHRHELVISTKAGYDM